MILRKNKMYPMRNRHSGLVSRGYHKLKEKIRRKQQRPVYKNGLWSMEEVRE